MNLQELDEIIADPDDVRMQALLIRERILGPTHPDTTYYIRYRGAVYADCGNFRKCILLWLYALDTQQKSLDPLHPMIQSSFLSFTELFQYMQKQLPQFSHAGAAAAAAAAGGASGIVLSSSSNIVRDSNDHGESSTGTNNNAYMLNMLNMYTSTVLKILQQAVEEIKRGLNLIRQQQKQAAAAAALNSASSSTSNNNNINQIQKQKLQSSLVYTKAVNSLNNSNKGELSL